MRIEKNLERLGWVQIEVNVGLIMDRTFVKIKIQNPTVNYPKRMLFKCNSKNLYDAFNEEMCLGKEILKSIELLEDSREIEYIKKAC